MSDSLANTDIAVVIPSYKVKSHILSVISGIPSEVEKIYVVDDRCPEETGHFIQEKCSDKRVRVLFHAENEGVGGAMVTGYRQALKDGAEIVVKLDGDGQMDPALIPRLVIPILEGRADYTKGNRFFDIELLSGMPAVRLFGNSVLSLVSKMSSGYWDIMDPTNGYTAIHAVALSHLPLNKLDKRYFFESDMLFRLNTIRAVVQDIPMESRYGEEISSLNPSRVIFEFPGKHLNCFVKRIFYNYFLRDFNAGTVELVSGFVLLMSGAIGGGWQWYANARVGIPATSGVVMLSALPILLGFQLLLSAIHYDVANVPRTSICQLYSRGK